MCAATRHLVIGGLLGVTVASVTGSDAWGWAAGLGVVLVTVVLERAFPARFGPATCAAPAPAGSGTEDPDPIRTRADDATGVEPRS